MAIKINGTTVIDNARELANIASLDATTIATLLASLGGLMGNIDLFTSSGTFTVPAGVTRITAVVVGGGAGGSKYNYGNDGATTGGSGGGRGATSFANLTVTPGASLSVVIGSAGNGSTANFGGNGGNGGDSTFAGQTGGGGLTNGTTGTATRASGIYNSATLAVCTTEVVDAILVHAYKDTERPTGQSSSSIAYTTIGDYLAGAGGAPGAYASDNDASPTIDTDGVGGVGGFAFIIY
jgi:hypothetical protein